MILTLTHLSECDHPHGRPGHEHRDKLPWFELVDPSTLPVALAACYRALQREDGNTWARRVSIGESVVGAFNHYGFDLLRLIVDQSLVDPKDLVGTKGPQVRFRAHFHVNGERVDLRWWLPSIWEYTWRGHTFSTILGFDALLAQLAKVAFQLAECAPERRDAIAHVNVFAMNCIGGPVVRAHTRSVLAQCTVTDIGPCCPPGSELEQVS